MSVADPARATRSTGNGPFAVGNDLRRFWNLTYTLAITDFKLRFFGSALGYLWSLMRPLLLFGVLYVVFTTVVKVGSGVRFYPAYLITAIVLWTYFAEATSASVTALTNRESLLRKMRFPRLVVPLSVALTTFFNLAANLVAVLVFALAVGVRPHLSWLEMPALIVLLVILVTGIAMLLSALYVRYRDVQPIWDVLLQALFYGSPVIYVVTLATGTLRTILMCNPMGAILTQMRHAFIDPLAPSAATAAGGYAVLLVPLAIVLGVFALGLFVFNRELPRFAENL